MEVERFKLLGSIPGLEGCSPEATGQARRPRIDSKQPNPGGRWSHGHISSLQKSVQGLGEGLMATPVPYGFSPSVAIPSRNTWAEASVSQRPLDRL